MDVVGGTLDDGSYLDPPPRLYERLRQIAGYIWDETKEPLHSSYDNWQVFGTKIGPHIPSSSGLTHSSKSGSEDAEALRNYEPRKAGSESGSDSDGSRSEKFHSDGLQVVGRISIHALREERAFHICKNLIRSVDPEGNHIIRPIDMVRVSSQQGDSSSMIACIFEHPGPNYLRKVIDYGPAWYRGRKVGSRHEAARDDFSPQEQVPLQTFLDFAVGATECLEILHHGQQIVHGEIRGDAFHMNPETGRVKLINFGSGLRTFEHGLTSIGWSTLSKEVGAKTKLCYMSPEQTGRMPAEPDSRTDIYSLGILFWTMLTQRPAFDGETPMDIIQGVLGRRLPSVSSIRLDIPDVVNKIIQKMTAKPITDRYHSASGLRHDLVEVRRLLGAGDSTALKNWQIATKDISSFFILPSVMIGRSEEHDEIVKVIDKVSRRHILAQIQEGHSLSSSSSLSEGRLEILEAAYAANDMSSEGDNTSSAEGRKNSMATGQFPGEFGRTHRSNSSQMRSGPASQHNSMDQESVSWSSMIKPWEKNLSLSKTDSNAESSEFGGNRSSSDGVGSLTQQRNNQKFSRKGRCEVISISGAAGLGKSCLVQSVQIEARRRGYFASSKFEQAKKTPFGPVLKLLSTLFKQVFSESNTNTPFHQILKAYVGPAWPMLHKILALPEFLLGPIAGPQKAQRSPKSSHGYNKSLRAELRMRDSSSSSYASLFSMSLGGQTAQDFLRAGSSTKSLRLMNTFLDVLRVFTQYKFICFCLDDLQYADDESLDLIAQIITSRMKMVIVVTYRPDEVLPERIKSIIDPPNAEGFSLRAHIQSTQGRANPPAEYIKAVGAAVTRITLKPLCEDDIVKYVAATLCRPKHEIIPLAAVIQSKTAGNPFYMREMLDTCHRKQCIWYDYRESGWRYDLDRLFKQFENDSYSHTLNQEFLTNRLQELPTSSRSILAWASLLGTSFSFELIQRLLSGEFDYDDSSTTDDKNSYSKLLTQSSQGAIEGLQAAIQAYIIVATQDDDRFRFAHDRYIQAAASLREGNGPKMHFIVAQTKLKYYAAEERTRDVIASHICESIEIINERVLHRQRYRKLLFDCAQAAAETGARPTAAKFYANCFALLQENPWTDGEPDVYYDETLQLYTRGAECYLYMGEYKETIKLLTKIFDNAKTAVDKTPAWVLRGRIFSVEGDLLAAFQTLKQCLVALDVEFDDDTSFAKCDAEFERLSTELQSLDPAELVSKPPGNEGNLSAVGAVLVEIVRAAFWSDRLTFYQMSLMMVDVQLRRGNFPQAGLAYIHLAIVAIARFNMIKFASEMGRVGIGLMERWRDPYTSGRGSTIYSLFVGHIDVSLHASLGQLEGSLEYVIQAGDRISSILNFGMVGLLKFFSSEHMADVESYCTYACEEIPNWQLDVRGGTMMIAVRQVSRALQGKTYTTSPADVMSDEQFNSQWYKSWLRNSQKHSDRTLLFYESLELAPLFLYGHYPEAVYLGNTCLRNIDIIWSAPNTRYTMFFQGLALAAVMWTKFDEMRVHGARPAGISPAFDFRPSEEEVREEMMGVVKMIKYFKRKIEDWQSVNEVNYLAWSKLLDAQTAEMESDHGAALLCYEQCLDHASANNFTFEEALGNYLLAGFLLRVGSRRPAKAALREAIMLYRQFGAVGIAKHIEDQHVLLLKGVALSMRVADAAAQTDFAGDSAPVQYQTLEGDENKRLHISTETKGDRIGAWQGGSARPTAGSGLPALDMLDLTSILESSQVISSVLQVDQLLKTMCEIILQNCGGLATSAAIVVEEEDPVGWSIAASGDSEKGAEAHIPGIPLSETALVAESVILYCTRFRETVFLPDLLTDERFSNVSEAWTVRNPGGKGVIAIPICHGNKPLLGVLYLEGAPNGFTDRNLTVLQLLVNQIGISYSNALTLKEVEKVSASNTAMVDLQKRALEKALEAENKANIAKAEALRNVKLAEEAAKAKSIFLANVSHELRTPLNGVIGNSELLRDSGLRRDQAEMADSIRISADLLLTVINDILDFSKMEADKMKLFVVAFNPDEMIREVVRSVSYSNRDKRSCKNVEIIQDINLPQFLIYGDPVRLHQVLGNLIGNSLKFTETGSITVGARTNWETKDDVKLTFWVKDTGIGIPPQQLVKLFKPFSQADASTARKYGGSGLGLSICKSLIESMMGGTIQLESKENEGTTAWFEVTFQKANSDVSAGDTRNGSDIRDPSAKYAQNANPQSLATYNDFSHIPKDQLRICIAEDNPINQKIAIQFMEKLGFKRVDAYENGLEAVEGLRRKAQEGQPYHIMLMDVQMPVLDGYEATKLLRIDPIDAVRGILVIAMTASAIQGDREKCLESGMNDYLAKPVRSNVLKKKLDQYLAQPTSPAPNLDQEAKELAAVVLNEANGSLTPDTDSPGIATPKAEKSATPKQTPTPPSSGSSRLPDSKKPPNDPSRPEANSSRSRKGLEPHNPEVNPSVTDAGKQVDGGDEGPLKLDSLAIGSRGSLVQDLDRRSRRTRDGAENESLQDDGELRSSSVVRSGTFADGTNFVNATGNSSTNESANGSTKGNGKGVRR